MENFNTDTPRYKIEEKIIEFPFFRMCVKTTIDPNGNKKVERKFLKKNTEEIIQDSIIVTGVATAINLATNGISHLIYSIKKKNKK